MPDTDAPSRSDSNSTSVPLERVNLPAVIPPPAQPEPTRDQGDGWLTRVMRAVFGWRNKSYQISIGRNGWRTFWQIGVGKIADRERLQIQKVEIVLLFGLSLRPQHRDIFLRN